MPLKTFRVFLQQLTVTELVAMRHDAVQHDDREIKKLIDEEIKRRDNASLERRT